MIFHEEFSSATTQVIMKEFVIDEVQSIHFRLLEGAFEHFFVIVKDPKKQVRALLTFKTRIKEYCLSASPLTSDNNTIPGVLWKGTWTLQIVRTYPVEGGCCIAVDVDQGTHPKEGQLCLEVDQNRIQDEREGWYQGDFHMHSSYSDGRVTHEEIIAAANQKHLDFIALSDHSTMTTKFPPCDFMVIPSTEITWDDDGHYNVHGRSALLDYAYYIHATNSKSEALDMLFKDSRRQGLLLTLNHPFPHGWELRHAYDLSSMHTIEVINAPHLFQKEIDNEKAVRFFDYLWEHGHYLYGIGGSDAHKKNYFATYPIAIPMTKVYCKGLSIHHVLDAAKKGNSYVQVYEDFEIAYCCAHDQKKVVLPGQCVSGLVQMRARCQHVVTWQLVKNSQVIQEQSGRVFTALVDVKRNAFYRLQARDAQGELLLFVNPIHNMKIKAKIDAFQEILSAFLDTEKD